MKLTSIVENPALATKIKSDKVTNSEKYLGYFVAPICAMISNSIFGSYLNRYYVDVLGWTKFGLFASLLPVLSVILVVAGNIWVGQLIDHTKTSQGKARPYLFLSIPLVAIAMLLMFMTPKDGSYGLQMIWIAVSYNLYYSLAYPMYYTAHSALVAVSTRNGDDRGLLSTLSNASMVAAAGAGASVVVPILLQSYLFVSGDNGLDAEASYAHWQQVAVVLCILALIGIMLEYFFTRERITEEAMKTTVKEEKVPVKQQIAACIHSKYWWIIIIYFFIFQFGTLLKNSSMSFFARWMFDSVINNPDLTTAESASGTIMSQIGLIGGIPTAVGIVLAWPIAKKLGKQKAVYLGLIVAIVGGLVSFIDVHNVNIVCAGIFLKSIGMIPASFVTLALLADVLEHLEAEHGFRSDGFTMSVYGAIMVGLAGLGNGIINGLLSFSGYVSTGYAVALESLHEASPVIYETAEQIAAAVEEGVTIVYRQMGGTEQVLTFTFLAMELIGFVIIIFLMRQLDVEKHIEENQRKIKARQSAAEKK